MSLILSCVMIAAAPVQDGVAQPAAHVALAAHVGDWEGVFDGFPASFQLVRNRHNRIYGAAPYGIYDLVLATPDSCPVDQTQFGFVMEGSARSQLLISPAGAFPYRQGRRIGSLTGAASAVVKTTVKTSSGGASCSTHLRWRMRPARRRPVADGTWAVSFADGEKQHTSVSNGGRVSSLGVPNIAADCSGSPGAMVLGGLDLFIPPDRQIEETIPVAGGGSLRLQWNFSSRTAGTGSLTASAPNCQSASLAFSAQHT